PRIKSPLLCSFILLELLSNNASTCRALPFCPVVRIRTALRVPDGVGPYRGMRANMEQTSVRTGLYQYAMACGARLREARHIIGERYSSRRDATCCPPRGSGWQM